MTDLTPRLDPEIVTAVTGAPPTALADIPAARLARLETTAGSDREIEPGTVELEDLRIPSFGPGEDVLVRRYRRMDRGDAAEPALVWVHGGGHVLGHAGQDGVQLAKLAAATGCAVYSVDVRLAPDHPFPAEVDDTYSALRWVHANAASLGVDPQRIVLGGASSGGGTAAGVALMARDRGEVSVTHQLLVYPMLDDRNTTPSSHAITDPRVWDRKKNLIAWRAYLGPAFGSEDVSPYAAPSRADDLRGLPSASIFVGDCDLFVDECLDYAKRLIGAGIPTEIRVFPGCPHGFDRIAPASRATLDYRTHVVATLRRVFEGDPLREGRPE